MGLTFVLLLFLAFALAWLLLPFLPGFGELQARSDARPVRVVRDGEVDVRRFARGYIRFIRSHLAAAFARCRQTGRSVEGNLPDGTGYLIVPGTNGRGGVESGLEVGSGRRMILSCGDLHTPQGVTYLREMYAGGSLVGGEGCTYRAVLAKANVLLGPRSRSLRWLHAGDSVRVGENGQLYGRTSADRLIELSGGCRFERLHAPRIAFGRTLQPVMPQERPVPLDPRDLPNDIEVAAGRWLVRGDLELPAGRCVEADLVVIGRARLGAGARIAGSIKSRKDLRLGRGVVVEGGVVGRRDVSLGEGCRIHGPVVAERGVTIGSGCVIGSSMYPTTVSARHVRIAQGVTAHGSIWSHREGLAESGVLLGPEAKSAYVNERTAHTGGESVSHHEWDVHSWTPEQRSSVVMEIMRGQISPAEACRKYGIEQAELRDWMTRFMEAGERALRDQPPDEWAPARPSPGAGREATRPSAGTERPAPPVNIPEPPRRPRPRVAEEAMPAEERIKELHAKIGELVMEREALKQKLAGLESGGE